MSVDEKVALNVYRLGRDGPHIKVDAEACKRCGPKECLYVCPVENYKLEESGIVFSSDACLECGACRVACRAGAVEWSYPGGGFGVVFRYG